jgi:phosphopantothenoylcysteine decarboxylase/phosphopantothenate--cysteine ligase
MGRELASAAFRLGADVVLVEANPTGPVAAGIERVAVETTAEMQVALAERFQQADLLLMAAAPADFRPAELPEGKLHRDGSGLVLELVPTEDIVAGLSQGSRDDQLIVAFAAEWGPDGLSRAREKLDRKGVDLVVLNDVSDPAIGFDSPMNRVCIVGRGGEVELETATKREIAEGILDQAVRLAGWTGDDNR